ncbi:MAG: hypothetical protein IJ864_00470 [Alphaproteobacteria bacterium]|nr:hypothetical protein [Alphaproteobacteria bacterium]
MDDINSFVDDNVMAQQSTTVVGESSTYPDNVSQNNDENLYSAAQDYYAMPASDNPLEALFSSYLNMMRQYFDFMTARFDAYVDACTYQHQIEQGYDYTPYMTPEKVTDTLNLPTAEAQNSAPAKHIDEVAKQVQDLNIPGVKVTAVSGNEIPESVRAVMMKNRSR